MITGKKIRRAVCIWASALCWLLTGCAGQAGPVESQAAEVANPYPVPAFQDAQFQKEQAKDYGVLWLDDSGLSQGYVALTAQSSQRLKFQIICGDMKYNYDVSNQGQPEVLPLNMGDGAYIFRLMESVGDGKYACIWSDTRQVTMEDDFQPYLRPSQMVSYGADSACVALAKKLAARCETDADVVAAVYGYLVDHIDYDSEKAATVQSGYLPVPDETLATEKGICFDYAALAAAMLRSMGIPCKLITGYVDQSSQELYHAWNTFYLKEHGWVTAEIKATPNVWQRVDITFAAGGVDSGDLTDDSKYTTRFSY